MEVSLAARGDERVSAAKVVSRRSGNGYRLVLRKLSSTGMPIVVTLDEVFATVDEVVDYAAETYVLARSAIEVAA
jgi:hypothetical protein